MPSCSRESRPRSPSAARAPCFSGSSPAWAGSIPMPAPSPTSIRTCSARAPIPARASTTSMLSSPRSPAGCRIRRFSATICSKAFSPVPVSPPISRSWRNSRLATTSRPCAITGGHAGIGSSCRGYSVAVRARRAVQTRSGMPAIGRWKMLDNLRRTLSAPAAILALLAGSVLPLRRRRSSGRYSSSGRSRCPL